MFEKNNMDISIYEFEIDYAKPNASKPNDIERSFSHHWQRSTDVVYTIRAIYY